MQGIDIQKYLIDDTKSTLRTNFSNMYNIKNKLCYIKQNLSNYKIFRFEHTYLKFCKIDKDRARCSYGPPIPFSCIDYNFTISIIETARSILPYISNIYS
ncbi:unnamed protein product [Meloidogyne enterolobii]|uniref:Uncharacterized protein n=1 Tax=Meloidogyne enterolobii TaxID=390850 RepID=A0ACB0ZMW9_MELEN